MDLSSQDKSTKITDYQYVNTIITNRTNEPITAEYNDTRNHNILGVGSDFKIALTRAKIPLDGIPLFLFEEDKYFISFGLSTDDDEIKPTETGFVLNTRIVQYRPYSDKGIASFHNKFPVFYVSDFIDMVNKELEVLWNNVFADVNYEPTLGWDGAAFNYSIISPPRFSYDAGSNLLSFLAPTNADTGLLNKPTSCFYPTDRLGIKLLMSANLWNFFNGFSSNHYVDGLPAPNQALQYHLNIKVNAIAGRNVVSRITDVVQTTGLLKYSLDYYAIYQDYSSVSSFKQFVKLVITSNIHVVREVILRNDVQGIPNSQEILTDLEFLEFLGSQHRLNAFNLPRSQWRYHDLKDSGPIQRFDLRVFVEYRNGVQIILPILPGEEFSAKFVFERKWHNDLYQISDNQVGPY